MKNIIENTWKKYQDQILYLIFGVLTTAVSFGVYWLFCRYTSCSAAAANGISWAAAVLFAYVTNKLYVFHSRSWKLAAAIPELIRFMATRLGSGAFETASLWLTVDYLHGNAMLWKLIASVVVILLNYFGSKLFVFQKKES